MALEPDDFSISESNGGINAHAKVAGIANAVRIKKYMIVINLH